MDYNVFRCTKCQGLLFGSDIFQHIRVTHHQKFIIAGLNTMQADPIHISRAAAISCLDIFGKETKDTLCFYLVQKYGINLDRQDLSLKELEAAFTDLLGQQAASVLIAAIHNKLNEKALIL